MKGWFVVRSHHQREPWAVENLLRQGAEIYLPRIAERIRMGRNHTPVFRARLLFPGYIFVKTEGQWRFLLGTYGVAGVIMQGISPGLVPDPVIADIKSREGTDGMVQLPERPLPEGKRFRRGDQVRVASGLYSGYVGIYDGSGPQERERILLDFLGRKARVLIGSDLLEVVE